MRRYIDADTAKINLSALKKYNNSHGIILAADEDAISEWIDKQPTADVRENVKGVWVHDSIKGTVCSVCGSTRRDNRIEHTNFCNVCGADMRGEQDDER